MTFVLAGRPRSFQYERATLNAVSFASAGQAVDIFLAVGVYEHRAVATDPHATGPLNGRIVLRMNQRREITGKQIVQHCAVIVSTRARFFEQCAAAP